VKFSGIGRAIANKLFKKREALFSFVDSVDKSREFADWDL
jgi:hypothetical protein